LVRRLVVVLALVFLAPPSVRAQEAPVSLGVLAGVDVADQAGEDAFSPHDRFGFIGGASATFRVAPRWSVQVDALFVQKGGKENSDNDPGDVPDEFVVHYLSFPVLLKFAAGTGGTRPSLFVGPSFAFEMDCTYDAFPDGTSNPVDCPDAGLQTRSLDVGIAFGGDIEIPLGSGHFVIDGRGVVGLTSFDDSDAGLDFKNRFLALMVGYRFGL
jgi:hypothetical protein